eukprot:13971335-Alexandrium_andersonii.AAC.1
MTPDGEKSRQAADAARALSEAAQAAAQSQVASESILLQGQPVVDATGQRQDSASSAAPTQQQPDQQPQPA